MKCISANTRPYHLHWGDQEVGNVRSCKKDSQVAGLALNPGFPFWILSSRFSPKLWDKIRNGKSGLGLWVAFENP